MLASSSLPSPFPRSRAALAICSAVAALAVGACSSPAPVPGTDAQLPGTWRAVLSSPGGELPFSLVIRDGDKHLVASAVNGSEEAPFSSVDQQGDRVRLRIDWYDSEIDARLAADGRHLDGSWRKTVPGGLSELPFHALKGDDRRFLPPAGPGPRPAVAGVPSTVAGTWSAVFTDEGGSQRAVGEFEQEGHHVTGTFLTPTGDYRYLEGDLHDGALRLSTFDGAHAFLFRAHLQPDGSLSGDFWSRDSYHATWNAHRIEPTELHTELPDPFGLVHLTNPEGRFHFDLQDLQGNRVASSDPRFRGKVVLVNLFGSWCPNCNDEAPLLARWYERWHDQGLEIVGLAFEATGDADRDRRFVAKYAAHHGLHYPLLLAGISDKEQAAAVLPDLDAVVAFPTTIFIGRSGRVRRIHSGFEGPGTGEHYQELVGELETLIERLLAEPVPASARTS